MVATVATSVLPWMAAKAAMEVLIQTTALVEKEATESDAGDAYLEENPGGGGGNGGYGGNLYIYVTGAFTNFAKMDFSEPVHGWPGWRRAKQQDLQPQVATAGTAREVRRQDILVSPRGIFRMDRPVFPVATAA